MLLKDGPAKRASLQDALRDASGWKGKTPAFVERVERLLATVNLETFPGAIIPRLVEKRMVYYAIAEELPLWRNLQGLLRSFVGRTLSDFTGITTELNPEQPFEALLLAQKFPYVARFVSHENREAQTVKALEQMQRVLALGERTHREAPLSTARVLYNFRLALSGGDAAAADAAIDFLRTHLRLDALNLRFLEVQRLAAFQEWKKLCGSSFFTDLCETRRPPQVTAALVEALYRTEFIPFDVATDTEGALAHFHSAIEPQYGRLFRASPRHLTPAVAKLFMVATLATGAPDWRFSGDVREAAKTWPADEAVFAEKLLTHSLLTPERAPEGAQPAAGTRGPVDFHNQLMQAADPQTLPTVERGRVVLIAAIQDDSLDAFDIAVKYVGRLSESQRQELLAAQAFRGMWHDISRFAVAQGVPQNWLEWAQRLPELRFDDARRLAQRAVTEWSISEHLQTPEDVTALIAALNQALHFAEDQLSDALPDLVEWIRQDQRWPNLSYRALYMAILDLLLYTNRRGEVLGALLPVLEGCLTMSVDSATYKRILADLGDLTKEVASVRQIDWLLGVGELTIEYPCPDPSARADLWCQICSSLAQFSRRLLPSHVALAVDIAETLGLPETVQDLKLPESNREEGGAESAGQIAGTVAIYTLTESVGQRAQRVLTQLYPGLRVELLADHVATPRLIQFARTADIFVICWASAKHAATTVIQDRRPPDRPPVFAPGGGSSSIVSEVQKHLQELERTA